MLAGLCAASMPPEERSTPESMDELASLVETFGGKASALVLVNSKAPEARSFIGSGKIKEIKELTETEQCRMVVFDNELSPSQMRVLTEELGVKVLDRSGLILDIFAQRAKTKEGRLQVELARYRYLLPRLVGMWTHLAGQTASGAASPVGTRGPGETQLEADKRHIRRKIRKLEKELEEVRRIRKVQRKMREKNSVPVAALVGYTNAGKSTLLNRLTGAGVTANDRLFDTLDTTTRKIRVSGIHELLISDTVGFIRKLPAHLTESFKATLEELCFADVLLHVVDISNPDKDEHISVTRELIFRLGAGETPCITVFNKCDLYSGELPPRGADTVCISAGTGEGVDELVMKIAEILADRKSG
ncbi:MAG: GTPase HflX [Oscillospiraceae bacterium]|nr:GTPase HflX [Oscillospiraceae bacterium]